MNDCDPVSIMMRSRIFAGFSKQDCEKLSRTVMPVVRELETDEILTEESMAVRRFGTLLTGRLLGQKYHYEGNVDLVQIFTPGDHINLETVCTPSRKSPLQILAVETSELLMFPYDELTESRALSQELHNRLLHNIIHVLANENMKKLYKIDVLYKRALRERILVFLRHMETRIGSPAFSINMDREQFAQYLGVNRSALSHELSLMRQEGLIEFKKDRFVLLQGQTAKSRLAKKGKSTGSGAV